MSQNGLSTQDFAIMAAAALVKDGVEQNTLSFDPDRFVLEIKDGRGAPINTINLQNFYARYTATEDNQVHERIFKQMIQLSRGVEAALTWDEAAPKLRPITRQKWWFRDGTFPTFDIGEHLVIAIGYDFDEHIQYVDGEQLEGWGVGFDEAFDVACNNLFDKSEFLADVWAKDEDKLDCCHIITAEDSYCSSRVLLVDTIAAMPVRGELLVAVPSKDHVLVTGSESRYGLAKAFEVMAELQDQPQALVPTLMRIENGYYVPYELTIDHPFYGDFRRLEMQYLDRLYHSQKVELQSQFEGVTGHITYLSHKVNGDIEVPTSVCFVAPEFIPCSLPKTDYVIFGTQEGPLAVATWERVEMILEEKLLCMDYYPVRYEINEFPNEAIVDLLGFVNCSE